MEQKARVGAPTPIAQEGAWVWATTARSRTADLTARECQVLGLVAAGRRNAEIAAQLYLSEKTVKTHINHIFTKLGVTDRVQAVLYYRASIDPSAGQDTTTG